MSETYELIGKDHEGNDIKEELELPTPDAALNETIDQMFQGHARTMRRHKAIREIINQIADPPS